MSPFFRFYLCLCPKHKILLPKMLNIVVVHSLCLSKGAILIERPSKLSINRISKSFQVLQRSLLKIEPGVIFISVSPQSHHTEKNFWSYDLLLKNKKGIEVSQTMLIFCLRGFCQVTALLAPASWSCRYLSGHAECLTVELNGLCFFPSAVF